MVKVMMICSALLFVSACGHEPLKINTDVKDRNVEVLYCPAPAEVARPELAIHQMTPEQEAQDGEVVKHWKATVRALIGYAEELEKVVDNQKQINKAYEAKKLELESVKPTTE